MKSLGTKLAIAAFLLTTGTTFAAKTIADGWYIPDYTQGQTPQVNPPSGCDDVNVLCATHYINGVADDQVFKPE